MNVDVYYNKYSSPHAVGEIRTMHIDDATGRVEWRTPQTLEEKVEALTELVLVMHRKLRDLAK